MIKHTIATKLDEPITIKILTREVYEKRIRERLLALEILGQNYQEFLVPDIEYAIPVVADMCRESVNKNGAVLGNALSLELFYKFFDSAYERFLDSEAEGDEQDKFEAWPLHMDFFQVLAHFLSYGAEIWSLSLLNCL
ncbi:hypothetical protein HDU97_005373 [Phlyctochytrium planicorne]|nr:hypothetical protein HDU97_005373 [Phlyctochytrium planicorne]